MTFRYELDPFSEIGGDRYFEVVIYGSAHDQDHDRAAEETKEALLDELSDLAAEEPLAHAAEPSFFIQIALGAASGVALDRLVDQISARVRAFFAQRRKDTGEDWREGDGYL